MKDLRKTRVLQALLIVAAVLLGGCAGPPPQPTAGDPARTPTDYSVAAHWLANPAGRGDKEVDVFFLYPTCCFGTAPVCMADDPAMHTEAAKVRDAHAGIFRSANFYAPFYRQLSLDHISGLGNMPHVDAAIRAIPLVDCQNAFQYYLEHYNHGRPIIFAAHSQGTIIARHLLLWIKDAHPEVVKRTIAAYLIGFAITPEYLAQSGLGFAEQRDDTGVIISYNTESPAATASPFVDLLPGGIAINPINWKRDATYASKQESLGSRIRFGDGPAVDRPHFADARLNARRGTVQTTAPVKAGEPWPPGVLHRFDYDLFWYDLRKNVEDRIEAWQAQ